MSTLSPDDLSAHLAGIERQVLEHHSALRNTLLRGHGAILLDRDRSLMSTMHRSVVVDMGETLRRVMERRVAVAGGAAEAVMASLDSGWSDDIHTRLAKAGVLGDLDLIAALAHRMAEHAIEMEMTAEGGRNRPPGDRASEGPAFAADNIARDLRLAKALTDYLVERSRRFDLYRNPKLPLQELPDQLMSRLFWATAAAWREQLLATGVADGNDLDDVLEATVPAAIEATHTAASLIVRGEIVADALADAGMLAPGLLPGVVRDGDICLFEAVLARLLRLPPHLLRPLTFEGAGLRLAVAARAAGMTRDDFAAIWRVLAPAIGRMGPPAEDAVALFDRLGADDAERLVRGWGRRPEYVDALRRQGSTDTGH